MTLSRISRMTVVGLLCLEALTCFVPVARAATLTTVYSFKNDGKDGYYPGATLTDGGSGTLYGTSLNGGTGQCINGCGTVFSFETSKGAESVLYSFRSKTQQRTAGAGSLLDIGGQIFGTTATGGRRSEGSLFSLKSGAFQTLYSFCNLNNCTDGASATSSLLELKGKLYGTTAEGGAYGPDGTGGVVFSFDMKTGVETPVYVFCSRANCEDGYLPTAGLIPVKSHLYGMTSHGGNTCQSLSTCGTVFFINPKSGKEIVRYAFCSAQNCNDGAYPVGQLIGWNGRLFGVTAFGGDGACGEGCGVAFSLDPETGTETVLHAFADDGADGKWPYSGLVELNGMLYGTTVFGGSNNYGAVYSIDPASGTETVIHSFCSQKNCSDGVHPIGGLLNVNGTLYGTTQYGGMGNCTGGDDPGCGTIFAITP